MYLERKIDNDFYIWQHNVNDVLVVQGPPCVGKTTSIQHYVKENFEHYYIIDLEDKIGKKFSNKFSNDIQNSKDFSQDLSQDGDTHGLHPVFSFIYNNEGEPITYSMLKDLENKLKMANNHFSSKQLWNSYAILNPNSVRRSTTKEESDALTNIIQLVRYAFRQIERLDSVISTSKQYFNLWLGQNQREITDKQREVISRIVDYIASNGACTIKEIREDDATQAAQMIRAFGNMQKANEALHSLYTFVVLRKAA